LKMDLEQELERLGVWHRFIEKEETVHTADASQATGIPLHRITKNLISITSGGEHVLLIVPGDKRMDLKKAAAALGVSNVQLYPFREAHNVSGYPPGGTPSIGLKEKLRTVLDKELASMETFYCGGGTRDRLLELRSEDVVRVSGALVAEITG
jgi:Cys-tRNA(Pro)/Cys-tRNA(Cys) deacylase